MERNDVNPYPGLHILHLKGQRQTWNLSKILHRRIFRPKILHRQFHLISTVLVIKTQKMSENEEIYTAGKNLTLPDFQAKNFTPSISPNFNSFSEKNTKK